MSQDVLAPRPQPLGSAPPRTPTRRISLRAARIDAVMRWVLLAAAAVSILVIVLVVAFLAGKAAPVLRSE